MFRCRCDWVDICSRERPVGILRRVQRCFTCICSSVAVVVVVSVSIVRGGILDDVVSLLDDVLIDKSTTVIIALLSILTVVVAGGDSAMTEGTALEGINLYIPELLF